MDEMNPESERDESTASSDIDICASDELLCDELSGSNSSHNTHEMRSESLNMGVCDDGNISLRRGSKCISMPDLAEHTWRPPGTSLPAVLGENIPTGALRSPDDGRDLIFEHLLRSPSGRYVVELPEELDLRGDLLTPRNQWDRPTCAAFAGSTIGEFHAKRSDPSFNEYLSPEYIYKNRDPPNTLGMYPRDVFKVMKDHGVALETDYPYQRFEGLATRPSWRATRNASRQKIANYARVTTIDGLKRSLYEIGICMMTLPMYNTSDIFWRREPGQPESTNGHAVAICGYSTRRGGFIARNSWGANWNEGGYFIFPYADWPYVWECWTCVTISRSKERKCIIA